jgi:hypothetical protein
MQVAEILDWKGLKLSTFVQNVNVYCLKCFVSQDTMITLLQRW